MTTTREGMKLSFVEKFGYGLGDTASNFASWQWVEGTFAAKPYFMNKDNIKNFSGGQWCDGCQATCPFDRDYPDLQNLLFGGAMAPLANKPRQGHATTDVTPVPLVPKDPPCVPRSSDIIWVHDAALSWASPALVANPMAPVIFVFNEPAMRAEPPAWRSTNAHRRLRRDAIGE
jgi:deoxyribodipyrimidine photo-lyase